jgi:hypothetical protein
MTAVAGDFVVFPTLGADKTRSSLCLAAGVHRKTIRARQEFRTGRSPFHQVVELVKQVAHRPLEPVSVRAGVPEQEIAIRRSAS